MKNLPYLIPDNDVDLNIALLLLIISKLEKSKKGKLLLNQEKLLIFMYLIKNPIMLDRVLFHLGDSLELSEVEFYSINSISVNLDPLFDHKWLKNLIKISAIKGLISVSYRKDDGFMFLLTKSGTDLAELFEGNYFNEIRKYLNKIETINTQTTTNLNRLLNDIFRNFSTSKQYSQHFN